MTIDPSPCNWRKQDLAYCSNVHAVENIADLHRVISHFISGVRQARRLEEMGAGLWFSAAVAAELSAAPDKCLALQALLHAQHIRLFTLNGFPFGNFHAAAVKEKVYSPDWSQPERMLYTQNLAKILACCLPDDVAEGTISTLPLGFRHAWSEAQQQASVRALCELAQWLAELKQSSGRSIRVCLEMEPDCVLESSAEIQAFFAQELRIHALCIGMDLAVINQHLGVCFDVCHQAVMFEDIAAAMAGFLAAEIRIGKIQVSTALQVQNPAADKQALRQFVEAKYLHQVRSMHNHALIGALDLDMALQSETFPENSAWRIHFHVPIQAETLVFSGIDTTQAAIFGVLDFLQMNPGCRPHLEVETYTWQVLPSELRPQHDAALIAGLTAELLWLEQAMLHRGLIA